MEDIRLRLLDNNSLTISPQICHLGPRQSIFLPLVRRADPIRINLVPVALEIGQGLQQGPSV